MEKVSLRRCCGIVKGEYETWGSCFKRPLCIDFNIGWTWPARDSRDPRISREEGRVKIWQIRLHGVFYGKKSEFNSEWGAVWDKTPFKGFEQRNDMT